MFAVFLWAIAGYFLLHRIEQLFRDELRLLARIFLTVEPDNPDIVGELLVC